MPQMEKDHRLKRGSVLKSTREKTQTSCQGQQKSGLETMGQSKNYEVLNKKCSLSPEDTKPER